MVGKKTTLSSIAIFPVQKFGTLLRVMNDSNVGIRMIGDANGRFVL